MLKRQDIIWSHLFCCGPCICWQTEAEYNSLKAFCNYLWLNFEPRSRIILHNQSDHLTVDECLAPSASPPLIPLSGFSQPLSASTVLDISSTASCSWKTTMTSVILLVLIAFHHYHHIFIDFNIFLLSNHNVTLADMSEYSQKPGSQLAHACAAGLRSFVIANQNASG